MIMNEDEIDGSSGDKRKSAVKQDLFANSCCKRLVLLLSQCSVMQYMQRVKVLIQLIHCWKHDIDVSITIIQKDFAQTSQIDLKEEPCLQDCQQIEDNTSPDIDEQDEDVQFDQLSSQYLNFDALQTSSNVNVDAPTSSVSTLETIFNDNGKEFESIAMIIPSILNGFEFGSESRSLQHSCDICGTKFNSRVDLNKHLRTNHLDRLNSKKKSFLPDHNEIVNLCLPKASERSSASKANVSVRTDKSTSVSKVKVDTSTSNMNLDQTIVGTVSISSGETSVGKTGTCSTTGSINTISGSKTSIGNNREDKRDKSVCETSRNGVGKSDNETNKKYKTVQSYVTDICSSDNDGNDSDNDSCLESEAIVGNATVSKSNDVSVATSNQDVDTSGDKNSKKSPVKEGEVPCIKCGKKFPDKSLYGKHITKCLNNKLQLDIPETPYKCSKCTRAFAELRSLKNHLIKIHKISGPLTEYEKGYACNSCDKRYETKKGLMLHMESHDPVVLKPFECNICGMRFKQKFRLKGHNTVHTGERPYKCTMCDKAYQQQHNLKDHIKIVHLNKKGYICSVCGNDFVTTTLLKYHMRVHTGEKSYKCDICNKYFRLNRQMLAHKHIHRDYKAYVCKICGAQFKTSGNLRRHSFIHADKPRHSCSVCGKGFNTPWNLRVHMRVHSGERPYMYGVCGMSFPHSGTWKKHEETHK